MIRYKIMRLHVLGAFFLIISGCQKPKSDLLKQDGLPSANQFQTVIEMPNKRGPTITKEVPETDNEPSNNDFSGSINNFMPPPIPIGGPPGIPPIPTDDDLGDDDFGIWPGFPFNISTPRCGDGTQQYGEECDFGTEENNKNNTGCNAFCRLPYCGNFVTELGEECDDGNHEDCDGCDSECLFERCGNNQLDCIQKQPLIREECDNGPGANTPGSGCSPCCRFEKCGNGIINFGEQCDDGKRNGTPESNCRTDCTIRYCPAGLMCLPAGSDTPIECS